MSFLQDLKGVLIIPGASLRGSGLFKKNPNLWPRGYAFGGWVYDANVTLGFSRQPTEITLSLVLESDISINKQQAFDISDDLLGQSLHTKAIDHSTALNFDHESSYGNFFTIELHGIRFNRMYLFSYSLSVDAGQKTLSVTFKDYSLILDKIYVGLMQRQGPHTFPGELPCGTCSDTKFTNEGDCITNDESWTAPDSKRLIRDSVAQAELDVLCPNCYLVGDGFKRGVENPDLGLGFSANLDGFFTKFKGKVIRQCDLGSFMGRVDPNSAGSEEFYDNLVKEHETDEYKADEKCFKLTRKLYTEIGGAWTTYDASFPPMYNPIWMDADSNLALNCKQWPEGFDPRFSGGSTRIDLRDNPGFVQSMPFEFQRRYTPQQYWKEISDRADSAGGELGDDGLPVGAATGSGNPGFTMDGGYLMLGTEEFQEKECGNAPAISYNFTELLQSLRVRGIPIFNTDDSIGSTSANWPDKNRKYRANYIGTLREVLEQWCGVFGLDFYYSDRDSQRQGFHFLDLAKGADISAIRDMVDPSTTTGKEFGATEDQKSVIISYKESSTLENTYLQRVITSNVKPFIAKERKKSVKRYVPIMPLHPLDFASPSHTSNEWESLLGERYKYPRLANFIPWYNQPDLMGDFNWDHMKRIAHRTNRKIWDIDISIALARLGQEYRDLYVGNRICDLALSTTCPMVYHPQGHPDEGEPIYHVANPDGTAGRLATTDEVARRVVSLTPKRLNGGKISIEQERDLKGQFEALGFQRIVEIEDFNIKENLIDEFLSKQEVEDISMDVSNYKMFLGHYDETLHQRYVTWEKNCAQAMYGFGAVMGGTLPEYPFIPRDYYGVMDGDLGFDKCSKGISIPKLKSSFEPAANQYPIYGVEQAQRLRIPPAASQEALNAPFNNILIESGNYLPTGLYISQLDNPWGTTVEHFEKRFWERFQDNACTEFNDSFNMIQEAGFESEPIIKNGKVVGKKKANDQFPFKTQSWEMKMFTPKFFKDTAKIFDSMDNLLERLHTANRIVDEVSVPRWSLEHGSQRFCKKLTVMVVTDTRGVLNPNGTYSSRHPNVLFDASYLNQGYTNYMARHQRELWERSEEKRHQRDDIRNRCDKDILYEVCEDAIQNSNDKMFDDKPGWGKLDKASCAVSPTGVYKEGWARELIGGYPAAGVGGGGMSKHPGRENSRVLQLTIIRNPNYPAFLPTSDLGFYHIQDLEQDLETLDTTMLSYPIVYPVNNYEITNPAGIRHVIGGGNTPLPPQQYYSGIWTADLTIEDRRPELIEIFGHPPSAANNTAGIRIVNNTIDPDLGAMMDPDSRAFQTKMYDTEDNEVTSIIDYHNYIAHGDIAGKGHDGLDHYDVVTPTKKVDVRLAGSLQNFPNFSLYCQPKYGMQNLTISLSADGASTSLSFSDRPAKPPQQEAILNKISPRTM